MNYEWLYQRLKQHIKDKISNRSVNTTYDHYETHAYNSLYSLMLKTENDYKIQSLEEAGYFSSSFVNSSAWTGRD